MGGDSEQSLGGWKWQSLTGEGSVWCGFSSDYGAE